MGTKMSGDFLSHFHLLNHEHIMLSWPVNSEGKIMGWGWGIVKTFSFLKEIPKKKSAFPLTLTHCVKMWTWGYGSHFIMSSRNLTEQEKSQPTSLPPLSSSTNIRITCLILYLWLCEQSEILNLSHFYLDIHCWWENSNWNTHREVLLWDFNEKIHVKCLIAECLWKLVLENLLLLVLVCIYCNVCPHPSLLLSQFPYFEDLLSFFSTSIIQSYGNCFLLTIPINSHVTLLARE